MGTASHNTNYVYSSNETEFIRSHLGRALEWCAARRVARDGRGAVPTPVAGLSIINNASHPPTGLKVGVAQLAVGDVVMHRSGLELVKVGSKWSRVGIVGEVIGEEVRLVGDDNTWFDAGLLVRASEVVR